MDSVQDDTDILEDVSDQISVSGNEQNVSDAERPGDAAPGGDHQETVVIGDESSLPGDSIEDSDSLLSQTLRPSRL